MTRAHDRQKTLPQRSVVHVVRVAVCLSVAAGSYRGGLFACYTRSSRSVVHRALVFKNGMPTRAWADELGSCVTDVIASRPEDPLKQLAHLLSRPNARPDWNETASAYAKRHNLEQQLRVAIDAVGLAVLETATPGAIDHLCRELRALAQPQVAEARGHRVVTYNLLSPELGEPARFPRNAAADLDPPTRLARIRARLAEHMAAGAVLCLQEVSAAWAVKLAPFFEEKRYTVVSAMYHSMVFTGYMGNLLCWPVRLTEVAPPEPLLAACVRATAFSVVRAVAG